MLVAIISSIIIILVGCLFHFTYEFSHYNKFVACFSAVNESVWEHVKIALVPSIIFCLIQIYVGAPNALFASAACLISLIILIPALFYPVLAIIKHHNIIVSIVEFAVAIFASQFIFLICSNLEISTEYDLFASLLVATIIVVIPQLSFHPPHFFLFCDSTNKKFGLEATNKKQFGPEAANKKRFGLKATSKKRRH